ncbi:hypothetical protein AKJ64_03385 [candidate division MSBL1 archaeon SCGC-AAA259E17]|uniref:Uncharacterized protein n=1 Tax=candidate division MSBL1 archaeon SCGC-AAA259E17 TaxID=1698263 RepID=A0A133UDR7_9EURY|nr:hypothetical protein AKJ64_03385 [candidate division MSBL1 archaeon SCGC-AAA259E17]
MSDWFDKKMKKLMKKFNEMFQKKMTPPRKRDLEPDKNFKTFEKKGPEFHMRVEMFNWTIGPGDSDRIATSEFGENKKAEIIEEEKEENKPEKLALRRFKEKNEEDEE